MLAVHAVDLLALSGRELLVGVKAPRPFEQPLPAQHFMAAGNAAGEIMGDVEEGAVAVGDARIECEQIGVDFAGVNPFSRATALRVQTLQWPSKPPFMRTRTVSAPRRTSNGTAR